MRIFISSTHDEMKSYRSQVHTAIHSMSHHAEDAVYWVANPMSPVEVCRRMIEESDLVVLLLGHSYGSIVPGEEYSYIEFEYRHAMACRREVLAFLVDDDTPWPPNYIEHDVVRRGKISALKETVSGELLPKRFTSPESLELLVVQAIAQADRAKAKKDSVPAPTQPKGEPVPQINVESTECLILRSDAAVSLGSSPFGLPQLLQVQRSPDMTTFSRSLYDVLESKDREPVLAPSILEYVQERGNSIWRTRGIRTIVEPDGTNRGQHYVSHLSVAQLLSPTLLSRIVRLPTNLRSVVLKGGVDSEYFAMQARTCATVAVLGPEPSVFSSDDRRSLQPGGSVKRIALSMNGPQRVSVVTASRKSYFSNNNTIDVGNHRPFVNESIYGLGKVCVSLFKRVGTEQTIIERDIPLAEYEGKIVRLLRTIDVRDAGLYSVQFNTMQTGVVSLLAEIARALEAYVGAGKVHGDIKPHNILVVEDGPVLIDSLDVVIGQISPGLTPGWCAPEQLAHRPVTDKTDVYPLALMLASALGIRIAGRVSIYVAPGRTGTEEPMMFLSEPMAYTGRFVERTTGIVDAQTLSFVEACLSPNPGDRPSLTEFGATTKRVASLRSDVPVPVPLGSSGIPKLGIFEGGFVRPVYVLADDWSTRPDDLM